MTEFSYLAELFL